MGKKIPPDWSDLGDPQIGRRRWRLGELEFDELSRELRLRGERVAIEPKPLDCLIALLRRPHHMASKEELCRWVWAGRAVSESVLTKSIAKLRIAIEDDDQHIVKTVHGYGYRLMGEAVELASENPEIQLKARNLLPKHPEIRLLRRMNEAQCLWSAELTRNQEPRVICASLEASHLPVMRRELLFARRLEQHPATSGLALPICESHLDQAPFFLCREPLQGSLLPDWLMQGQRLTSARSDERALWLVELCTAVARVHEAGLHFDGVLKPDCFVILEADGQSRQIQLNLGLVPTWLRPQRQQTIVPDCYRAPELLAGLEPGPAADVYALGVLGYHLFTNKWSTTLAPGWEELLNDALLANLLGSATHQMPTQRLESVQMFAQRLRELPQKRLEAKRAWAAPQTRRATDAVKSGTSIRRPAALVSGDWRRMAVVILAMVCFMALAALTMLPK